MGGSRLEHPTREIQHDFWRSCGPTLHAEDRVSVARGMVASDRIRDVRRESVPGLAPFDGTAALFFVDRAPGRNWAHPCTYVVVLPDGRIRRADHLWPPWAALELIPLSRPPGALP